jgi:hypothetical protein
MMPYNKKKEYLYTPIYNPSISSAFMRTHNERRSRLEIGNAFFRSINKGQDKNYISVQSLSDRVIIKFNTPPFLDITYPTEEILITSRALADVRLAINSVSKLIEMLPPDIDIYDTRPSDVETAIDPNTNELMYKFLEFPETYLSSGDGLPLTPSGIITGPERSLVHINYGEDISGNLTYLINNVYEWVGSSFKNGKWELYYNN